MPILPDNSDIHKPSDLEVSHQKCYLGTQCELGQIASTFLRKHVFSDLQPYVCTFENCSESPFSTRNEWFQHELDSHRRRWECILCDNSRPKFSHKDKITAHFKEQHNGVVTENQVDLIIGACETPMTKFDASACPLCSEWVPPSEEAINTREFRRHLARHLQQISLEALPLYIDGLEIHDTSDEGDIFEYHKATVLSIGSALRLSPSLPLAAGDQVLVLENKFDKDFWLVYALDDGHECQMPSRFINITGLTEMSLGKPSACYSMNCSARDGWLTCSQNPIRRKCEHGKLVTDPIAFQPS